jgi:hypothetical protein
LKNGGTLNVTYIDSKFTLECVAEALIESVWDN